jgi:hypothetical protein
VGTVQALKDATPAGVLLGSVKLAAELDRLDLMDEYRFLVHPRIAGHSPAVYQRGQPSTRRLELVSAIPLGCGAFAKQYRRAQGGSSRGTLACASCRSREFGSMHRIDRKSAEVRLASPRTGPMRSRVRDVCATGTLQAL